MRSYKLIQTDKDGTRIVLCYCADKEMLEQVAKDCAKEMPGYRFDVMAREKPEHVNAF